MLVEQASARMLIILTFGAVSVLFMQFLYRIHRTGRPRNTLSLRKLRKLQHLFRYDAD